MYMYYIKKAEYKLNGITTFSLEWEGKKRKNSNFRYSLHFSIICEILFNFSK